MSVLPNDYDSDPGRFPSNEKYLGGAPVPRFDGEDAEAIVASVFGAPGDTVEADRWDGPLVALSSVADAVACLRVRRLGKAAAADAAAALDLPPALTKRGCLVHATKALEGNS